MHPEHIERSAYPEAVRLPVAAIDDAHVAVCAQPGSAALDQSQNSIATVACCRLPFRVPEFA